jgi:signal peptidase I
MNLKKILFFVVSLVVIILLFNLLFMILPIKTVRTVSQNMDPTYSKNDILFYINGDDIQVNDVILLGADSGSNIVTRIIIINQDGTYEARADNNLASLELEKEIQRTRIKGEVVFSVNPFIFYVLLYGIQITIALLLTRSVYSKIFKK